MSRAEQLSLSKIYTECMGMYEDEKPRFLALLEEHIDLDALVPHTFTRHFYAWTGRRRKYPLTAFIWALLLQRVLSIPTDSLLINFLRLSKETRDFCGFAKVPDASKFTRFKQRFLPELRQMFDSLVDLTEPICQSIDPALAAMTIFDTSGIEAYVAENNPKYADNIIRRLKNYKKAKGLDDSFDPYKAAYGSMPPHAAKEPAVKQLYINGHFCYVYKFGMVTNGLGIVRDVELFDEPFLKEHPEIAVEKKSDSPDEDKSLADSKAVIPVLSDFFRKHPSIGPKVFLGDSAFDTADIYHHLFHTLHFEKAYIPLNERSKLENADCPVNEDGIPCCPRDPRLPMKPEGGERLLRCGLPAFKFVCPKMKWVQVDGKSKRRTFCEDPCTGSPCGRMVYVYPEKDLRACPGTLRGTPEWDETYKTRSAVEKSINQFKSSFCVAGRKTQNGQTLHADLLLSGITQLISVILADKIHQYQFIRTLKPLIA